MAKGSKRAQRQAVDTSGIVMLSDVEIPRRTRGSKYPWARLVANGGNGGFFIPLESEERANQLRSSIQSSGRVYLTARGLPYNAVSFVSQQGDQHGVTCAIVATPTEGGDSEE